MKRWVGRGCLFAAFMAGSVHAGLPSEAGLVFHIDASELTGLTNNAPVAAWPDLSENGADLMQPTTNARPAYVTNAIGGMPAVNFSGSHSMTNLALSTDWPRTAVSWFLVVKLETVNQSNNLLFALPDANNNRFLTHFPHGNGNVYWDFGTIIGDAGRLFTSRDNMGTDSAIWHMRAGNNAMAAVKNGTVYMQKTGSSTFNPAGKHLSLGLDLRGLVAEIIVYERVLTESEEQAVGLYLADKYSIATAYAAPTVTPGDFSHKRRIEVTGYTGTETLTNFPVLVKLNPGAAFDYGDFASPDGGDLRFGLDGSNEALSFDVDRWGTNGTSCVWVRLPALTNGTTFWAYWGNAAGTNLPAYATDGSAWLGSYAGVWHMNAADAADSTAHGNHGTAGGTVGVTPVADGMIGGCVDLPGSTGPGNRGYVSVPSSPSLEMGSEFSASVWATYERGAINQWERLLNKKDIYSAAHGWEIGHQLNSDQQMFMAGSAGSSGTRPAMVDGWRNGQWELITVVYDGATIHAYGNGEFKGDVPCTSVVDNAAWPFVMGNDANYNEYNWNGKLDEVRLSDTVRSADWVKAAYDVVANHDTFLTCSDAVTVRDATDVSTISATLNGELAWVSGTADVAVCWGTVDGGTSTGAWQNVAGVGSFSTAADLAHAVSALSAATVYHYRFTAAGAWSDAATFRTLPADAAGLALWWDATTLSGVTNGQPVGTLRDWSGNGNDATQVQSDRQPGYADAAMNGQPALRFDGSGDGLYFDGGVVVNTDYSIFIVERRSTPAPNNYIFIGSVGAANQNMHIGYRYNGVFTHAHYANDYNMDVPSYAESGIDIFALAFSASDQRGRDTYLNGAMLGGDRSLAPLTAYPGAALGTRANQNMHYGGDVAEVLMFDRALTPEEHNAVGSYLETKYGLDTGYGTAVAFDPAQAAYSADVTFDGYAGAEVLTNFPALVRISETEIDHFAYAQCASDRGLDLRFTLKGSSAALSHEVEQWSTAGTSYVWVQIPGLTNNTTITAYWGNPSVLSGDAPEWLAHGAAWDGTFRGVWHLAETAFPYADSTMALHDGASGVQPVRVAGDLLGPAQDFNGSSQKIDVPYSVALNPGVFSVSCWAKVEGGAGQWRSPVTSRGNPAGYIAYAGQNNIWQYWVGRAGGWGTVSGPEVTLDEWVYLVMAYDGANMAYYVNGTAYGPVASAFVPNTAYPLRIGAGASEGGGNYWFNGVVDEVRVADVVRSADWVDAAYANVSHYTNFVSMGAVSGPGPSLRNLAPTIVTDHGATANGLLSTAAIPTTVWLYWGDSDAGGGDWQNTNALGVLPEGTLSSAITGLTAIVTYHYRFFASNALGTAWAIPTESFTTKGAGYLTITPSAGPNGAVSPAVAENLDAGEDSSVYTFTADAGYCLTNVIVDGTTALGPVASHQFTNVTANHTIQALFGPNMYTVTVAQVVGGTIIPDPAQAVAHGADSEVFTIAADAGYYLVDVKADGAFLGAVASHQFTAVTGNHTLTAEFAALPEGMAPSSTAFWIQADKLGLGHGALVDTWPELSGHTNDLFQPTSQLQPTFLTNGFNGLPAVDFAGGQSMANAAMNADWPASNATIFVVARASTLGQNSHLYRSLPWSPTRFSVHLPWSNGNNYFDYGQSAQPGRMQWNNAGTDQDSIWCLENEAGVFQAAWRNGALRHSETTTGTWNPAGYRFELGATYQGQIAELIIMNEALDELDRNRVGYYLEQKYGVDTDYVDPTTIDVALSLAQVTLGQTVPTATGPAALQGGAVQYVISVTNSGPTNASGVVVTDLIPPGLSYQSHSGGSYDDGSGQWTIGGLAHNVSTTLTVTVTIDAGIGYGVVSNTASITAVAETDRIAANDSASTALLVWQDDVVSADYAHRVKITFPGYTRSETLTNFPALVTLGEHIAGFDYDGFESALGADLRFTEADGETVIPHEVETWNADGDSIVWVRVPALQVGTYVWAYWGNDGMVESGSAPTNVAGCVLWLKSDAGVLTDGFGNVTNWLDQSGNGLSLSQANAAMQPLLVSAVSALGGNPAIRFDDPADDGVGLGPVDLGIGTNGDRTVVMVVIPEANPTQGSEVIGRGTSQMLDFGTWTQNGRLRVRNGSVNAFSGQYSVRYNRPHVVAAVGSDGASVLNSWVSGEQMQTDQTTTAFQWPIDAVYVGLCNSNPNRSYEGDLAELIIYDRALTHEELNDIGMYLTAKYAIKTSYNAPAYTVDGTVWTEGYSGVWHLDDTTAVGSGPNDAYGRPADPDPAEGRVGGGQEFFRLDQIELGTRPSISGAGPFAVSAWMRTSLLTEQVIFQQRDVGSTQGQLNLWVTPAGYPRFWCHENGFGFDLSATNALVADGNWHHVTAVREGTEGRLYVDGALVASQDPGGNAKVMNAGIPCGIGRDIRDDNKPFNGRIDEVRFSDTLRSTNWIWATYLNQASNSTFVGSGTVEGSPIIVNLEPAAVNGTFAMMIGELVDTGGLATTATLYWGTSDGGSAPGVWGHTNALGVRAAGPLVVPITTLSPGVSYHYRFAASNAYTVSWATPTVTFTTPSAGEYAVSASSSRGGAISPSGVGLVAAGGDSATYTFVADEGYALTNVVVDGSPQGVISEKTFTSVSDDHTIVALFGMKSYAITVTQSAGGTVTPDPAASVTHGADSEMFMIVPDVGHYVQDVLVDEQSVGVRWEYTFEDVTDSHTLRAVFAAKPALPVTNGLGMWVAADAIGIVADGQPVGSWQDLSGNGRHAEQPVAGQQPSFTTGVTNILNGHGAVRFDGVDDILPFDGTFLAGTDYTVFIVEGRRSSKNGNYLLAGGVSLADNDLHLGYRANAQITHAHWANDYNVWVPGYDQQEFMVYTFRMEVASGRQAWWNGGLIAGDANTNHLVTFEGATIGGGRAALAYSDADFAEVIIYTRALTPAEHQEVGRYLQDKYDLAASYRAPAPEVGDPVLWIAADEIPNRSDGETVLTWPDLSGTGRHATKELGAPVFVESAVNGKPAVRFDGSNRNHVYWNRLSTIRTVFWVVKEDVISDPLYQAPLLGDTGSRYDFHRAAPPSRHIWDTVHAFRLFNGTTKLNGAVIDGRTTSMPTEFAIISARTSEDVIANSFSNDRNIWNASSHRTWDGDLAELIIYDRVLSDEEENQVGVYLVKKYGIAADYALPGTLLLLR